MKTLLTLAIILLSLTPAAAVDYEWPVLRVISGNTVAVDASANLPRELGELTVTLGAVTVPGQFEFVECDVEQRLADEATSFTANAIGRAKTIVTRHPAWREGVGAVSADLILDGQSLSTMLLDAGHANWGDYQGKRIWRHPVTQGKRIWHYLVHCACSESLRFDDISRGNWRHRRLQTYGKGHMRLPWGDYYDWCQAEENAVP